LFKTHTLKKTLTKAMDMDAMQTLAQKCDELVNENRGLAVKKEKLEDLNKVYLQACEMKGNEITTLQEENARLKRTGGSADTDYVKKVKAKYQEVVKKLKDSVQGNTNLKDLYIGLEKKNRALVSQVSDFKPTLKELADVKEAARKTTGELGAYQKDFRGVVKQNRGMRDEIERLKMDGVDKETAREIKDLRDKVSTQVGSGSRYFYSHHLIFLLAGRGRQDPQRSGQQAGQGPRRRLRASRPVPHGAVRDAQRVPVRDRADADDQDPRRGGRA